MCETSGKFDGALSRARRCCCMRLHSIPHIPDQPPPVKHTLPISPGRFSRARNIHNSSSNIGRTHESLRHVSNILICVALLFAAADNIESPAKMFNENSTDRRQNAQCESQRKSSENSVGEIWIFRMGSGRWWWVRIFAWIEKKGGKFCHISTEPGCFSFFTFFCVWRDMDSEYEAPRTTWQQKQDLFDFLLSLLLSISIFYAFLAPFSLASAAAVRPQHRRR